MDDPWRRYRDATTIAPSSLTPALSGAESARAHATADRVIQAITASGFQPLVVEDGTVVLSGFTVEPACGDRVTVRWVGQPEVNTPPYRRTFLSVYSFILLEAGLTVQYVGDEREPHLVCRAI